MKRVSAVRKAGAGGAAVALAILKIGLYLIALFLGDQANMKMTQKRDIDKACAS